VRITCATSRVHRNSASAPAPKRYDDSAAQTAPTPSSDANAAFRPPRSARESLVRCQCGCNSLGPSFPKACVSAPLSASTSLSNPSILTSPCIGVQNLSPTPLPPCLQWITPILQPWLRRGSRIPSRRNPCASQIAAHLCPRPLSSAARRVATGAEGHYHHSRAKADVPDGSGAPGGVCARACPSGPLCCWPRTHQSVLHLSSNLRFDPASPPLSPSMGRQKLSRLQ
jgi:hypothetical protein